MRDPLFRSNISYRRTERLWKDFFQSCSMWYDNRNMKYSHGSPDFKHRITKESLWIDGLCNPPWILTELGRKKSMSNGEIAFVCEKVEDELRCLNLNEHFTFVEMLKACAITKDLINGTRIHATIVKRGLLEKSPYLASTLINMYAKCGLLLKAQEVLDELPTRDIVAWSALIAGYAQQGKGHEALDCYRRMLSEGCSLNAITYTSVLKACGIVGAVDIGKRIHYEIFTKGLLEKNIVLGTALVDMYAKCGRLSISEKVLHELPARDIVTWNALIAGYAQKRQGHEALKCFDQMRSEGLSPDPVTFTCILNACGSVGAIDKGTNFHDEIANNGLLANNIILGNALVDMYVKCGLLTKAKQVLDKLPVRDIVSWNVIITGYAQHGQGLEALKCFDKMQSEGIRADIVTFTSVLKACGCCRAIEKGRKIHNEIVNRGLLEKNIMLGTALVDMYAKCGMLAKARETLDGLPTKNAVCLSASITGYVQHGQGHEAFNVFQQMQCNDISPETIIFISMLKACSSTGALDKGKQIHDEIVAHGLLGKNGMLGNAVIDMYAKCGTLIKAQQVFDELPVRDVVSWNAIISGYAQHNQGQQALDCFEWMQREGISPDTITFACILKASASIGAIDKGKQIHDEIRKRGLTGKSIVLDNALIDMYAKCGMLKNAQELFNAMHVRDSVSWNALISGYAQEMQAHEALKYFEQMQSEGFSPDEVTFASVLKACGNAGMIDKGEEIHNEVVGKGFLENDSVLGTSLVDMYAKCGLPAKALQILLHEIPVQTVPAWNAVIAGYAQEGQGDEAVECFEEMQRKGFSPDSVTILCVLNGCAHSGLVEKAELYFYSMGKYGVLPSLEHYTCMVDVFSSAGLFDKAISMIRDETCSDYPPVWLAILSASRKWGNVEMGKFAFDQALQLDSSYGVYYIIMENIYAAAGMKVEAERVETMRVKNAAWEKQDYNVWVDPNGKAHLFSIGDKTLSK